MVTVGPGVGFVGIFACMHGGCNGGFVGMGGGESCWKSEREFLSGRIVGYSG